MKIKKMKERVKAIKEMLKREDLSQDTFRNLNQELSVLEDYI